MADVILNAGDTSVKQPALGAEFINTLTLDTIVPSVFVLGQYGVSSASQAAALTTILQNLLSLGVYESIDAAYSKGIPVGTFVIVDNPETPDKDFSVEVVQATRLDNGDVAIDFPQRAN
jgi:hypothetical protein